MSKFELVKDNALSLSFTSELGKNESYVVTEVPGMNSLVVRYVQDQLLDQLSMEKMFQKLSTTSSLFLITYLAVSGLDEIHAGVYKLRDSFIKTMSESATRNYKFKRLSSSAASDIVYGFHSLIDGINRATGVDEQNEDLEEAKETFAIVAKAARTIATEAEELVNKFYKPLHGSAIEINTKIINSRALSVEEKGRLEETIRITGKMAKGIEDTQKALQEELDELLEEYQKYSAALDKAEDRAFAMAIVSTVTSVLTAGIQGYISTTPGGIANNVSNNIMGGGSEAKPSEGSKTSVETQKKITEEEAQLAEINKRIENIDKDIADIDKEIGEESDKTKIDELKAKKQNLSDQKVAEKENVQTTQASVDQNKAILAGLAAALDKASESTDKLAQEQSNTVERLSAKLDSIAAQRTALNKEKREMIMKAAEYAATIENSTVSKNELELAINALSVAVTAMSFIISTLNDYADFWSRIAAFTESLAADELSKLTNRLIRQKKLNIEFLQTVIINASSWVVLNNVFGEYEKRFQLVYKQTNDQNSYIINKDDSVQWNEAIKLAAGMSDILKSHAGEYS